MYKESPILAKIICDLLQKKSAIYVILLHILTLYSESCGLFIPRVEANSLMKLSNERQPLRTARSR